MYKGTFKVFLDALKNLTITVLNKALGKILIVSVEQQAARVVSNRNCLYCHLYLIIKWIIPLSQMRTWMCTRTLTSAKMFKKLPSWNRPYIIYEVSRPWFERASSNKRSLKNTSSGSSLLFSFFFSSVSWISKPMAQSSKSVTDN